MPGGERYQEGQRRPDQQQRRCPEPARGTAQPETLAFIVEYARSSRSRLERARLAVVDYLSCLPPQTRPSVMLGALASVCGQENVVMDTVTWLGSGAKGGLPPGLVDISPA
jgi:hypothetical protein